MAFYPDGTIPKYIASVLGIGAGLALNFVAWDGSLAPHRVKALSALSIWLVAHRLLFAGQILTAVEVFQLD
jgi:hypothetical protein